MPINLKKYKILFVLSFFALLFACNKVKQEPYVAKVGDRILSEEMLKNGLNKKGGEKYKEEYIRQWIEKELLFQSAVNQGITTEKEYSNLIENAKVDIANAILIRKFVEDSLNNISENELKDFFVTNISEFKLPAKQYLYNIVSFNSRNEAIKFRQKLKLNNWNFVLNEYLDNSALVYLKSNLLSFKYNIYSPSLANTIEKMKENRYSRIVETSSGIYTIVKLKKVYKKNDVPEFYEIKNEVRNKFLAQRRKQIYNDYIEELYLKYGDEIER